MPSGVTEEMEMKGGGDGVRLVKGSCNLETSFGLLLN